MIALVLVLFIIVLLAGLYLLTCRQARRAEAALPPVGAFVSVQGLRLHYVRQGTGPTVVLLHGSEGFLQDYWPDLVTRLSGRYDVIAFDRPGHGYSESPAPDHCGPDSQAEILHAALVQLNVSRPLLVGHSWSGALLMAYALLYPQEVAGLTLLAGWVYAPDTPPLWMLRIPALPLLGPLAISTLLLPVKGYYLRKSLTEAFAPDPVPHDYARLAASLWQRWPRQAQTFAWENTADRPVLRALSPRYPEIQVPVVIVTGEHDQVVPAPLHAFRLHAAIPHSELIILPNTGHELPQTRPQAVSDAIDRCYAQACSLGFSPPAGAVVNQEVPPQATTSAHHEAVSARSMGHSQERARELVMRYGWNAMSYQILAPDIEHWFAADDSAVIGFTRRHRVRVVAGAPVCPLERLEAVILAFEHTAAEQGETVCYFGAAERLEAVLNRLPYHDRVVIGAQPVWNPVRWPDMLQKNSSLRGQLNRARNKDVRVEEWAGGHAQAEPALQRCLDEWLASRALPTLRFLTAPVPLDHLGDRRLFVATRQAQSRQKQQPQEREEEQPEHEGQGEPVGFLIATPIPERNGWLIEQIARGRSAPNGTAELLVDGLVRAVAAEGAAYVTLGLAPLSQRAGNTGASARFWLRLVLDWLRAHGNRFYNFEGLDAFKAKFKPDAWEPLYAISNEAHFSPRTLYAIAAAFSEGTPILTVAHALLAALKQEIAWKRDRTQHKKKSA